MNSDVLYVTPKLHENGETDVVIRATANGLFTETSIHFTVVPVNDNVEVNRTLASLVVYVVCFSYTQSATLKHTHTHTHLEPQVRRQ